MNRGVVTWLSSLLTLTIVGCAAHVSPSNTQSAPGAERVYIDGPIDVPSLNRHITPGDAESPTVSADTALAEAARQMSGFEPTRVLYALVEWNRQLVWVVTYEGGSVCQRMPLPSGADTDALCAGNAQSVRIDAMTGDWLDTFGDGPTIPIEQLQSVPLPTMDEVLEGKA